MYDTDQTIFVPRRTPVERRAERRRRDWRKEVWA